MRSRGNRISPRSFVRSGAVLVAAAVRVSAAVAATTLAATTLAATTLAATTLTGPGRADAAGRTQRPFDEQVATTAATAAAATTAATGAAGFAALYRFDQRAGLLDLSGHGHTLRRLSRNGGATRAVVHGVGQALAFPRKCSGSRCPRVVLQAANRADLNPGTRPLAFGAAVNLARTQTTGGQNVVQKGYSVTGSQYKLQIDGAAGRPSCVLVDRRRPRIRIVRSSRAVADGTWHTVQCRRVRSRLTILVDGRVRGSAWVPATLSVVNSHPLSIGGKGVYPDNDQFRGVVDDVWVRIG
jgi:hypothetical protein